MRVETSCDTARFLLDGDNFFAELHRRIIAVEEAGNGASIRLAYWKADPSLRLPAVDGKDERTLSEALSSAVKAGVKVQVILWNGWKSECFVPHHHFWRQDWSEWIDRWRSILLKWKLPEGSIEFKYHSYAGNKLHPFTSLHVKIALFDTGEEQVVLLGGMNLGEDYKSSTVHDRENHWHDAAVKLTGDVYRVVGHYWSELWAGRKPPKAPSSPDRSGGETPVTFVTTDVQGKAERDIRTELVRYFQLAKDYIYMENQALTDPCIIDALVAAAARGVKVIIVVPHPKQTVLGDYSGYAYVMNFAFRAIAMARMTQFTYAGTLGKKYTVRKSDIAESSLRYEGWLLSGRVLKTASQTSMWAESNDSYITNLEKQLRNGDDSLMRVWRAPNLPFRPASQFMNRGFHWKTKNAWVGTWVYLEHVTDIESTSFSMYSPLLTGTQGASPYVHSKVALIDDEVAFIGSSNWTYRSMQFDAEVSAVIQDGDFVRDMREELFEHWGMPKDLDQWRERAEENLDKDDDGSVRIVPLTLADLQVPYTSLTAWGSWAAGNMI
ncbi:phosphatidylserine/phosphatidylglycerophosphate/cardiolipin synthase family protein [Myxococcus sp. K15C18031901]|uniref:phospholipase D-like domain-containing protein n=1 Tax=Myxococcus dinghuensis TaxID=2906761 RepID=UPI0020A8103B|nr:phosphatidylserine/phosphatidylglycerophosphate/cardiolipin synthase family protein [Myxococcus dinghuensis]MCP3105028.1 phosphatidylserine/phosphatidylglycerophosphate/cardiolipin synthase family protein [Myxococcus dinghuensis]